MGLNITNITNDYKKLNKKIHNVWKKYFSNGNISGFGGIIFNNIQPTSIDDFYEKQQKYANENIKLKIRERGLTYDELIELAKSKIVDVDEDEEHFDDMNIKSVPTLIFYNENGEEVVVQEEVEVVEDEDETIEDNYKAVEMIKLVF